MDAIELAFAGAARQARLVADGTVSSRELVGAVLDRIDRLNPVLNAFRAVYAEGALAQAEPRRRPAVRRRGRRRPAAGRPRGDQGRRRRRRRRHDLGHRGARAARRCRTATSWPGCGPPGAIVVGRTNVPELMQWPFTETLTFGATRNPWALDRTPGGSSGGSGAAVAAGLCGVAQGSDGAGSIRIPAACCGLFGLKPTRGRIPLGPANADAWHGLSVFGPLARTVADAALFLDVDRRRRAARAASPAAVGAGPGRLRVGVSTALVPGTLARLGADQRRAVEETADLLRSLGHEVGDVEVDYGPRAFRSLLTRYLRGIHDDAASLPHPERLERRTRGMARLGALVPARHGGAGAPRRARAGGAHRPGLRPRRRAPAARARGAALPHRGAARPRGALDRQRGGREGAVARRLERRRAPRGLGPGRVRPPRPARWPSSSSGPADAEARLLALGGQLEAARPWADRRPPVG